MNAVRLIALLRRLTIAQRGAAAIEFALVLPVLLLFLFGAFEFGLVMHVSSLVENATHEGARLGMTGSSYEDLNPEGLSREEFIEKYIRKRVGLWVRDDETIEITTKVVGALKDLGVGGIGSDDNNGFGGGDQTVIYNVTYYWNVMTPFVGPILGEDGTYPIRSVVVMKNEDFCGGGSCFSN